MNRRTIKRQRFEIELGEETVTVNVEASVRKSLKLALNRQGEVTLKLPRHYSKQHALQFLTQHHHWLQEKRQQFTHAQQKKQTQCYLQGRALHFHPSEVSDVTVTEHCLLYPQQWSAEIFQQRLDTWQRAQAYILYEEMIERWWPFFSAFGERPTLRVKKMTTRWGSLSKRGYINLNLALLQLPPHLLELVVVHELCHLKHFDHGKGFQQLMTHCLDDWQQREDDLLHWQRLLLI